jgi:hypothetical protein
MRSSSPWGYLAAPPINWDEPQKTAHFISFPKGRESCEKFLKHDSMLLRQEMTMPTGLVGIAFKVYYYLLRLYG